MQTTTMPGWKAFRRTSERYLRADGSASNYWVAYCIACERAYARYEEAVAACQGDDQAIAKIDVVRPAERLPGRSDRMHPHLKTCKFMDPTVFVVDADGRGSNEPHATPAAASFSSADVASRESEAALCRRLGLTSHQFQGVRSYLIDQTEQLTPGPKRRKADPTLESFFSRDLSAAEKGELDKRLLRLVADRRLPFSFVESQAFINLVSLLRQSAVSRLPSRRQLGGPILDAAAADAKTKSRHAVRTLLRGSARATLMLDGYKTANNTHILGAVIGIGAERHILDAEEEGYQHHGVAAASEMASVIDKLEADGDLPIGCVCTDDAGQCGRARRILALRYPKLVFLRCLAHQVNLLMKHVLQDSSLRPTSEAAVSAASLLVRSSAKLLPQARASMHRLYGISLAILSVCETRWSSLQMCMASLLRVRGALRCLVAELGSAAPDALLPLNSDEFWRELAAAEWVIRPIAHASFLLERDDTTLADAFGIYGSVYQHLASVSSHPGQARLCADLERRWGAEEQVLFLLAFCLHPQYMHVARELLGQDWRSSPVPFFSIPCLANASAGYFAKWFPDEAAKANAIVQQMFDFLTGDVELLFCAPARADDQSYQAAGWTWLKFWEFLAMSGTCSELAKFALSLLGCKPQTASVERLFKEHAAQQSKPRNRMGLATLNKVTSVKCVYDQEDRRRANVRTKSRNRVLAAAERVRSTPEQSRDAPPATAGGEVDDPFAEDAPSASTDVLHEWAAALGGAEDADEAVLHDPRGEVPAYMAFDFSVPALPEQACPLPSHDVPGYPQEVVWRLRNFRAAKFPLRHLVGSRVGEQFAVDMCALMREE